MYQDRNFFPVPKIVPDNRKDFERAYGLPSLAELTRHTIEPNTESLDYLEKRRLRQRSRLLDEARAHEMKAELYDTTDRTGMRAYHLIESISLREQASHI